MKDFYLISKEMLIVKKLTDLDLILHRLKEAALWLQEMQVNYWQNWLDPELLYIDWIQEGINSGQFFEASYENQWLGIFRIQWSDELFWGQQSTPAGYLHSFTTNRQYAGQHLGTVILEWLYDYCRQSGREFLRLDCGSGVKGLCRYYEDQGFEKSGEITVYDNILSLYQKRL